MSVSWWDLDPGREYYIETNEKTYNKYKMIFMDLYGPSHYHDYGNSESAWFSKNGFMYEFNRDDKFYDVEEIRENAQKAREQMEDRALKNVLKKIVNETFDW